MRLQIEEHMTSRRFAAFLLTVAIARALAAGALSFDVRERDYDVVVGQLLDTQIVKDTAYSHTLKVLDALKGNLQIGDVFPVILLEDWTVEPDSAYLVFAKGGHDPAGVFGYDVYHILPHSETTERAVRAELAEVAKSNRIAARLLVVIVLSPVLVLVLLAFAWFIVRLRRLFVYLAAGWATTVGLLFLIYLQMMTAYHSIRVDLVFAIPMVAANLLLAFTALSRLPQRQNSASKAPQSS